MKYLTLIYFILLFSRSISGQANNQYFANLEIIDSLSLKYSKQLIIKYDPDTFSSDEDSSYNFMINDLLKVTYLKLDSAWSFYHKNGNQFNKDNIFYSKLLIKASKNDDYDLLKNTLEFLSSDVSLKYINRYPMDTTIELSVKVINEDSKELEGYDVFVSPSMSLDVSDVIKFNPTNNARRKIRPGNKLIRIVKDGVTQIEEIWNLAIDDLNSHLFVFRIKS